MSNIIEQTILLVEDTLPVAQLYEECLKREGFAVTLAENGKLAREYLDRAMPSAIVLDLMLPDINGMEILQYARSLYPELPVIVVTATNSINVAVEAMQLGACDFIVKPVSSARLVTTVRNALERTALVAEVTELRQIVGQDKYYDFIGQSPAMQALYRIIDLIAPSRASVFIRGEVGTGKDMAALAIHKASPRRLKPFRTIDCAAIQQDEIESYLFGDGKHQAGAILATTDGTLFFDEVSRLPLDVQIRLLRFLQTGEILPPGAEKPITVDIRVLASTTRDPLADVHAGGMREDLYYRLNTIPLDLPPLRDREEDVTLLAQHFLAKYNAEECKNFTGFDDDVIGLLRRYDWPGNVRQLENLIRNVVVLNSSGQITLPMMPNDLQRFTEKSLWPANQNLEGLMLSDPLPANAIKPLWLAEREMIIQALDYSHQDITQAAALLQVSPSTLYRKVQAWRLEGAA